MNKNLISRLFMLVAIVAAMVSCTEKTSEYTNVIPADAAVVVEIHAQSLLDKSGANNDEDKQKLIGAISDGLNAATSKHVEQIIKDGSASGLSVKDPVYIFSNKQVNAVGIAAKVDDIKKLKNTFEVMATEEIIEPITESNGLHFVKFDNEGICVFNESTLLVYQVRRADDIKEQATKLMKQDAKAGVAENASFQNMLKKKGDIRFFFNLDALPREQRHQFGSSFSEDANIKEIDICGSLSFEKGKIALLAEICTDNKEVKDLLKKQQEITGKLNETFLANFPASTLMYMTFNINGEKLYDMIQNDERLSKQFQQADAEMLKGIFSSVKGDISLGLTNVTMSEPPTFIAYAEAKNGSALEQLYAAKDDLKMRSSDDFTKVGDNEYILKSRDITLYFGYKDSYIYATTDPVAHKNIGKKESKSLKEAAYASHMKGKSQFVVIDVKSILDLPMVKMLSAMGGREAATYINVISNISYLEVTGNQDNQSEINLWLTDEDTNSLKQIVDLAKQYAGL